MDVPARTWQRTFLPRRFARPGMWDHINHAPRRQEIVADPPRTKRRMSVTLLTLVETPRTSGRNPLIRKALASMTARIRKIAMAAAAALLVVISTWPSLAADKPKIAPEADKLLHAMSDLCASVKQLSVSIVADLTVKPTFVTMSTKSTLDFERPIRIAARAVGGLSFISDGTKMNVFESVGNSYLVADAPKSLAAAAKGTLEKLALGQGLEFAAPL